MSDVPANIQEFSQIAGLTFAQLYKSFPAPQDIDQDSIAKAMGVEEADWRQRQYQLPSGQTINQMIAYTIAWLNAEQYIVRIRPGHPMQRVLLTTKGLAAMQAIPSGLKNSLGVELTKAVEQGSSGRMDVSWIGELFGGVIGGLTKSLGGG